MARLVKGISSDEVTGRLPNLRVRDMTHRWPMLLVAVLALVGGIMRAWQQGQDGFLVAGAALILLGLWAGLEARDDPIIKAQEDARKLEEDEDDF